MPNTLTDTQWTSLFHALEVPYSTSYNTMNDMGMAYVQAANQPILSAAKDVIIDWVTNQMEPKAVADLVTWLNKWYAIADAVVNIQAGGAGSLQGVNLSFKEQRAIYKQYIQDLVPFFKWHEVMMRSSQSSDMQINVSRG